MSGLSTPAFLVDEEGVVVFYNEAAGAVLMVVKVWGARGSIPSPGPETTRYGGNTSCVQITLSDGTIVVLDAGTGLRNLGLALTDDAPRVNILLTHLHL